MLFSNGKFGKITLAMVKSVFANTDYESLVPHVFGEILRETSDDNDRITSSGDDRITADSDYT
jgi:hypothetical protein